MNGRIKAMLDAVGTADGKLYYQLRAMVDAGADDEQIVARVRNAGNGQNPGRIAASNRGLEAYNSFAE